MRYSSHTSIRLIARNLGSYTTPLVLVACLGLTACGLAGAVRDATTQTVAALDTAIAELAQSSDDWQRVIEETRDQLADEAQSTVRNELSNLLQRGIAASGVEIRCTADFLGTRIRQALIRIKARILHTPVPPREPVVCAIVPTAVDMSLEPARRSLIEIFGFDFDVPAPFRVLTVATTGTIDVTGIGLTRQTYYHLTLNLGSNGIPLQESSEKITLLWGEAVAYDIPVIQALPPTCKSRLVTPLSGSRTFTPTSHTNGDRDFAAHGPQVNVIVRVVNATSRIEATITMSATETVGDWTDASGSETFVLWSVPPGEKIRSLVGPLEDSFSYSDTDHEMDRFERGGSPVLTYVFVGDTEGDEAGTRTNVQVIWNPAFQVELVEAANCIEQS